MICDDLQSITSEAVRFLAVTKQTLGAAVQITMSGAQGSVKEMIEQSELNEEITLTGSAEAKSGTSE